MTSFNIHIDLMEVLNYVRVQPQYTPLLLVRHVTVWTLSTIRLGLMTYPFNVLLIVALIAWIISSVFSFLGWRPAKRIYYQVEQKKNSLAVDSLKALRKVVGQQIKGKKASEDNPKVLSILAKAPSTEQTLEEVYKQMSKSLQAIQSNLQRISKLV